MKTILILFLAAVAVFAADVSGKWVAQVPGRGGETRESTFTLKADGNQVKLNFKGKVSGDVIKFTRQREGGDRVQEFTAKKSS